MKKAKIKEIFTSVQGEGIYVGCMQLFIRFCGCNLSCSYCDTKFDEENCTEYDSQQLADIVNSAPEVHSVSLTGGEPLLWADFLSESLPKFTVDVYLETNGTLVHELEKVIRYVDIVAMDIKLDSSSENGNLYNLHDEFLRICTENKKHTFIKLVFDGKISETEIENTIKLAKKYDLELVMQPVMEGKHCSVESSVIENVFGNFVKKWPKTRLIPQTHKFLNLA